jgi:hypothetical protein
MVDFMPNPRGLFIAMMPRLLDLEVKAHKQNCKTNISRYNILRG